MENFVQNDLEGILQTYDPNKETINEADFYGRYCKDHTKFVFSMGERILIEELVLYVKETIETKGVQYFAMNPTGRGKRHKPHYENNDTFNIENVGRFFTQMKSSPTSTITDLENKSILREKLYDNIKNIFRANGVDTTVVDQYKIDGIAVERAGDQSIYGEVNCALCTGDIRIKVSCRIEGEHVYWTTSNVQRHLTKKHSLVRTQKLRMGPKKKSMDNSVAANSPKKSSQDESNTTEKKDTSSGANTTMANITSNASEAADCLFVSGEVDENQANDYVECNKNTTIVLEIAANNPDELEIFHQLSKQVLVMTEMCLKHGDNTTTIDFKVDRQKCEIDVAKTKPNGQCLFSALAHQLFDFKANSIEHDHFSDRIRAEVCEYIQSNLNMFQQDIKGCIYNQQRLETPGKSKKIENFQKEAEEFLSTHLSKKKYWGGLEALKAVSLKYEANVLIVEEKGSTSFALPNGFRSHFARTLLVAYRINPLHGVPGTGGRRNHYDSGININMDDLTELCTFLSSEANRKNECPETIELE